MAGRRALEIAWKTGERAIDLQLAAFEAERHVSTGLVRLGVASMAGSLATAGLVQQAGLPVDVHTLVIIGLGVVLQVISLAGAMLLRAGPEATSGPEPGSLYVGLSQEWSETELLTALLEEVSTAHRRNADALRAHRSRSSRMMGLLLLGALLVLLGSFLIVGGAMIA